MKYRVYYETAEGDCLETVIDVPNHIPYYDPTDVEDVPLYIKANIKDLEFLEHYEEAAE
jgi:hypothetical protein